MPKSFDEFLDTKPKKKKTTKKKPKDPVPKITEMDEPNGTIEFELTEKYVDTDADLIEAEKIVDELFGHESKPRDPRPTPHKYYPPNKRKDGTIKPTLTMARAFNELLGFASSRKETKAELENKNRIEAQKPESLGKLFMNIGLYMSYLDSERKKEAEKKKTKK